MADFDLALPKILRHEGVAFDDDGDPIAGKTGYSHHVDDPGGETNYGITRNVALANGYIADMIDIPYFVVRNIYRRRYWDALLGDDIPDQAIAEELFDSAVNMGIHPVVTFLQRTLNVLNGRGVRYKDVKVDGGMGPATLAALTAALAVAPWYRTVILRALDSLQAVRYIELAEKNDKFETFLPGWLRNRVGAA